MLAAHSSRTTTSCSPCPGHRQPVLQALQWGPASRRLYTEAPTSTSAEVCLLVWLLLLARSLGLGVTVAAGSLSWLRLLGGRHWSEAHSCGQRAGAPLAAAVAQLAAQALLRVAGPCWRLAGCLGVGAQGLAPDAAHALQGGHMQSDTPQRLHICLALFPELTSGTDLSAGLTDTQPVP